MLKAWTIGAITAMLLLLNGCGGGGSADEAAANKAKLAELETMKAELDQKRTDMADLDAKIKDPSLIEVPEGEEPPSPDVLQTKRDELKNDIDTLSESLSSELVDFEYQMQLDLHERRKKNANAPQTEEHLKVLRMMSSENMIVAQSWIDKQGDYNQAIQILEESISADPNNEELKAALEKAQSDQYMTEERFANVKKGMTEDEVREQIGQVFHQHIREYPEQKAIAWFYPREDEGTAGVYFTTDANGNKVVYKLDFNALKPKSESEETQE